MTFILNGLLNNLSFRLIQTKKKKLLCVFTRIDSHDVAIDYSHSSSCCSHDKITVHLQHKYWNHVVINSSK